MGHDDGLYVGGQRQAIHRANVRVGRTPDIPQQLLSWFLAISEKLAYRSVRASSGRSKAMTACMSDHTLARVSAV